jgi:hypothetical protein
MPFVIIFKGFRKVFTAVNPSGALLNKSDFAELKDQITYPLTCPRVREGANKFLI